MCDVNQLLTCTAADARSTCLIAPFRVINNYGLFAYGLFAVMTRARYEIEFQGTRHGRTWTAYPFRHKPQDPLRPPGIYAPYQPRFRLEPSGSPPSAASRPTRG